MYVQCKVSRKNGEHQTARRDQGDGDAVHEADVLTEKYQGDEDGKDDAEFIDGRDLCNVAVLEREKVKEPRERARNAAERDEEKCLFIGKDRRQVGGMSLCEYNAYEKDRHDDGAHRRCGACIKPRDAHLAEDGDECRAQCREQRIEKPRAHGASPFCCLIPMV